MISKQGLNIDKIPDHLAIIMDGNGRWAKKNRFNRSIGHKKGAFTVRKITKECVALGIKYLTLYAFSTENWNRPKLEVTFLMKLFNVWIKQELPLFIENNVRFNVIGDILVLSQSVQNEINTAIERTKNNNKMIFTLAISYSSRLEIVSATKAIAKKVVQNRIDIEAINEEVISDHLFTKGIPEVDLLIRTSGEQRISNFLLWQLSYAELYFSPKLWPEFQVEDLHIALKEYQNRNRRFGKV